MKHQVEAKLLNSFGFTVKSIATTLNTTQKLVRAAIADDSLEAKMTACGIKPSDKLIKNMGTEELVRLARNGGEMFDRFAYKRCQDVTYPHLELLLSWGKLEIKRFNTRAKQWKSNKALSLYYNVKESTIRRIRTLFGYYSLTVPYDYHDQFHYLPVAGRIAVKKRDEMTCNKCDRKLKSIDIKFTKISHPGPNTPENFAILCKNCRLLVTNNNKYYQTENIEGLENFRRYLRDR